MSAAAIGIRAIDHINLSVSDLGRSLQFYQQTFGFQLIEDGRKPAPEGNTAAGTYAERSYVILGIADTAALALHQGAQGIG